MKKDQDKKRAGNLLGAILDLGKAMIVCGGEIWRVEETLEMIFETYCFKNYDVLIVSNGMHATVRTWDGRVYTQVRRIKGVSYDLDKLERLFSLASGLEDQPLGVDRLRESIYEILESPGIPLWKGFAGSVLVACGFCVFYNGDINDVFVAAVTALIVYHISKNAMKMLDNSLTANTFSAFIMEVIILLMTTLGVAHHQGPITISTILLLIGGLSVTSGFKNVLHGDALSGIIDTTFSILGAVGIALGIMIAMFVMPGEEISIADQPHVSGCLMQLISCTVGCAGFAMMFGVKSRTLIYSAAGAAITWIVALIVSNGTDEGVFAAALAGAAFVAFYAAVLEKLTNIPAIVILTACIFPLIPGSHLYYTVLGAISSDYELFRIHGNMLILICIGISIGFIIVDVGQRYLHFLTHTKRKHIGRR